MPHLQRHRIVVEKFNQVVSVVMCPEMGMVQ